MSKWIEEELEHGLRLSYGLNRILNSTQSKFQKVDVVDTQPFGTALLIDGLMQSSDVDEYIYHECLVHPALLSHSNPRTVFIGGGGEGGTAREVLRHKSVEKCVMVDIDGDVVDFCKEALPANTEAFNDPRLELIIDDAKFRLENSPIKFDVIIMDLDDPLEGGPCYQLYTKSFYEMAASKLEPGGILVTQCSGAGVKSHKLVFAPVGNTLKQVFPVVHAYNQAVWSFADEWGWQMAFSDPSHKLPSASELDAAIPKRLNSELRFLDGSSFQGLFALSKTVRRSLLEETRVLSVDQPAFFFGAGNANGTGNGLGVDDEPAAKRAKAE